MRQDGARMNWQKRLCDACELWGRRVQDDPDDVQGAHLYSLLRPVLKGLDSSAFQTDAAGRSGSTLRFKCADEHGEADEIVVDLRLQRYDLPGWGFAASFKSFTTVNCFVTTQRMGSWSYEEHAERRQ